MDPRGGEIWLLPMRQTGWRVGKHAGYPAPKSTFFVITWSYLRVKNVSFFPDISITFFFRR